MDQFFFFFWVLQPSTIAIPWKQETSFGTTKGWVNDDNMTIFGWTPPLGVLLKTTFLIARSLQGLQPFGYQHGIQMQFITRPAWLTPPLA